MDSFKYQVLLRYHQMVDDRIDAFRDMISALTEDSRNDAKGSAGDKHETALSMMQLEQEKLNLKLAEFLEQKAVLNKISSIEKPSGKITLGSLVHADDKYFFIAAALPKVVLDTKTVFAISPQSPLGAVMIGKETGDEVLVQGKNYQINNIL